MAIQAMTRISLVESTWRDRARTWSRYTEWCGQWQQQISPQTVALFLAGPQTKTSTKRSYLTHLRAFGTQLGYWELQHPTFNDMQKLLGAQPAEEISQALPLGLTEIQSSIRAALWERKAAEATFMQLAWTCAARVADTLALESDHVNVTTHPTTAEQTLTVDWKGSKTLKKNPFREVRWSTKPIHCWDPETVKWLKSRLRTPGRIFDTTARTIVGYLRRQRMEASEHSIRRGKLWHVADQILQGQIASNDPIETLRMEARHECRETTIRYMEGYPRLPFLINKP